MLDFMAEERVYVPAAIPGHAILVKFVETDDNGNAVVDDFQGGRHIIGPENVYKYRTDAERASRRSRDANS